MIPGDATENNFLLLDRELFAAGSSEISEDFLSWLCHTPSESGTARPPEVARRLK